MPSESRARIFVYICMGVAILLVAVSLTRYFWTAAPGSYQPGVPTSPVSATTGTPVSNSKPAGSTSSGAIWQPVLDYLHQQVSNLQQQLGGKLSWSQECIAETSSPPGGYFPNMAFDEATGKGMLFGGITLPSTYSDATWNWDGTAWQKQSPAATPGGRVEFAMAYDAARQQVVLFGGYSPQGGLLSDTWVWDGMNWTEKFPAHHPPARRTNMAYDAARQEIVIYGGSVGSPNPIGDTWVWDGTDWTQMTPATNPPSLSSFALAYDAATKQTVLFGGWNGKQAVSGTWTWDGTNWTQQFPTVTPPPRVEPSAAYDSGLQKVVVFGGIQPPNIAVDNAMWEWDGSNWAEDTSTIDPPGRGDSALMYDSIRNEAVLFGGANQSGTLQDTWVFGFGGSGSACDSSTGPNITPYLPAPVPAPVGTPIE